MELRISRAAAGSDIASPTKHRDRCSIVRREVARQFAALILRYRVQRVGRSSHKPILGEADQLPKSTDEISTDHSKSLAKGLPGNVSRPRYWLSAQQDSNSLCGAIILLLVK